MRIPFTILFILMIASITDAYEQNKSDILSFKSTNPVKTSNQAPVSYYKCPKCDNIISRISSPSYNTAGAKHYSDGKISGPLYRERPEAVICDNCKYPFWMKDDYADPKCYQSQVFTTSESEFIKNAQKSVFYGPETYDKFLRNHIYCSRDEEKYLLTRYWRALNDKVRDKLMFLSDPCDNDTARSNLNRLISILEEENDELMNITNNAEEYNFEKNKLLTMCLRTETEIFDIIKDIYTITGIMSDKFKVTIKILKKEILSQLKSANRTNFETLNFNLFTIAELYRNLGKFELSSDAFSSIESENNLLLKAAGQIKDLCGSKIRLVSEI